MRGKFKCLIDIGNNKEKKYVKGTWNIIIVNVNLNTVSIYQNVAARVPYSLEVSSSYNSKQYDIAVSIS